MNHVGEQIQQQLADRANLLTQVRNQMLAEGFKGLVLVNAGGAAALGAFAQAVWDKPTAAALLPGILGGICFLLLGTAVATCGYFARFLAFSDPNAATPGKNPWTWVTNVIVVAAVVLFITGMAIAVCGAYHALPTAPYTSHGLTPAV